MTSAEFKKARQKVGFNMKQMACALKIPYSTYTKWERGERSPDSATQTAIELIVFLHDHNLLQEWIERI